MLTNSYRTRGAIFAFLLGPPRGLKREDGTRIHSALCDALGADDIAFKFQPGEPLAGGQTGFSIHMERQTDRDHLVIEIIGEAPNTPIRLLFRYDWPESFQLVLEDFDAAFDAVFGALGTGWQRVLAEARVRGQVDVPGASALSFLGDEVLHLTSGDAAVGGRLSFVGFKYETASADFTELDQLANPKRDVTVEVLRQDPRCLYLEVMSQWPQLAESPDGTLEISPGKVRSFHSAPSEYLRNTMDYLETSVIPLLSNADSRRG